jgi:hypothetical protein
MPPEDTPLSELPGSLKKPAWVPGVIPTLRVLTKVRSSDTRKFRRRSELSADLIKKLCSDLAFWIPIQIVPNLWETCKISLRGVFYWDKTTPLNIYERIIAD